MEPHQLRYFLALAKAGSFVKAADHEGVTQPSLSQQIKKLEADLGVPLFHRLGRSVQLTHYGEAFLPSAEKVLLEMTQARKSVAALQTGDGGPLSVGVIPTLLPFALVKPLAEFQRQHPAAEVLIEEQTTDDLVSGLRAAHLDLAIVALPLKVPELICSELFREPLVAVLPPKHPLASAPSLDISSLAKERMLLLREGHCLRDDVLTACSRANAELRSVFETDQLSSIFAMVANGLGVSLVPELAARHSQGCVIQPLKRSAFRRVGYAQAAGHAALPIQRRLIKFLREWNWLG